LNLSLNRLTELPDWRGNLTALTTLPTGRSLTTGHVVDPLGVNELQAGQSLAVSAV